MNTSEDYYNMRLVNEVKRYPLLYNFHVAEYGKRDACEEAWENIAKVMNETGEYSYRYCKINSYFLIQL